MPGKPSAQPVTPQQVARWHDRRGSLLAKLHAEPDGPWAWLWRVHVGIADYLIHRYGGDGESTDPQSASLAHPLAAHGPVADGPGATSDDAASLTRPYRVVPAKRPAALESAESERLRCTLRNRLSSLHATNDDRRACQPPILPNLSRCVRYHPPPGHERPPSFWQGLSEIIRTTYPETTGQRQDRDVMRGIDPLDEETLALLKQAMKEERDWRLDDGASWSDDEVLRFLSRGTPEQ